MSVEIGSWVWVSDEEDYVLPAQVVSLNKQQGKFRLQNGVETELSGSALANLQPLDPQCLDDNVSNLIGLSNLSENALLHNLRIRFKADSIYTFVSSILIAVNPFRQLPIYGVETLEKYRSTVDKTVLPPHIFTIADNAYRAMMTDGSSQSVVISGESGAGKTESTKLLLEFIAELSGRSSSDGDSIQQQILQCNPVMEAFGNAKTVRNNNSSRFGKLITIRFGHGSIKGAGIISYLLEKSRVVHQQSLERNYHFFYQLVAAAAVDKELASELCFTADDEHYYISQSGVDTIEGVSDLEEYNEVRCAMEVLGMSSTDQMNVCRAVAGILHIGNIKFLSTDTSGDAAAKIEDMKSVERVGKLLGINEEELQRCLTSRNIGTRSIITCTLTPTQALEARDALSKKLYAILFDWLIANINTSLAGEGADADKSVFIAVLDIFGFEAFEHNSFEQLCINYCNEKLQYHFNNHIFLMEQQEYAREGVGVTEIKFEDNQPTLDLLETKSTGIFSMIDEEISVPRGSDEGLLSKILQKYSAHPNIQRPRAKVHKNIQECFVVVHYAGEVAYNVIGFLEKNKDALSPDLEELGRQSAIEFISLLFKKDAETTGNAKDLSSAPPGKTQISRRATPKKMGLKNTLGNQFKQQLATLMETLNTTDPHFVRCMKPNMEKVGRRYDSTVMLAQLRYAGLLEVCRIRQLGYPNRMPFEKFLRQYLVLQPSATDAASLAALLSTHGQLSSTQYVLGHTKIFLKHSAAQQLDAARDAAYFSVVCRVQRIVRGKIKRRRFALFMRTLTLLKTAMGGHDKTALEEAVAQSVDLPNEGNHLAVVKSARNMLRRFKEEDKVSVLLTEAIAERQLALLEGAVRTARGMKPPLDSPLVQQAVELAELVKAEKSHIAAAPDLVKERSLPALEAWMAKAEELNISGSDAARSIQTMIDRLIDEQSLLEELQGAMANRNAQILHAFIGKATEMGLDENPIFIEAKRCLQELEEKLVGIRALEVALETPHMESLKSAVDKAGSCGVTDSDASLRKALHFISILEQVASVEIALKKAVDEAGDLEGLQNEVKRAEEVTALVKSEPLLETTGLEVQALSTAKSLIQSLTKQKQADAAELSKQDDLANSIRAALTDKEFSYLRAMIAQAKGQGMSRGKHSDLIKQADEVLEKMKAAMDVEMALAAAIRMRDVTALNSAIAKAEATASDEKPSSSLSTAIKLRSELVDQESILEQLKAAVLSKDILSMDKLVRAAEQENMSGRLIDDAKRMIDREGLVGSVQQLLEEATDAKTLSEAIEKAIQLGLSGDVMDRARARHLQMSDGSSIAEEIKSAIRNIDVVRSSENGLCSDDLEPLRVALKGATPTLVESDAAIATLKKQADSTLARAEKQLELQAALLAISDLSPLVEIKKAVRLGADAGLKNYRGFVSASAVLDRMDETNTASIIQRALTTDEDFTYEKFDQMKEELYSEARQDAYNFTNFAALRTPEEFAKGSMLNKRKIMDGFLKHQKGPIGRSLTNLSADDNRIALIAFKSLLGYCGDKAVTFPASQALDFLNIGLSNPNLRNELFLQAIKQTTGNPSSYGQARAFHVICLCCDTFQPQPDFYYYVINFLLSHVDTVLNGVDPNPMQQMAMYALGRIQAMHNSDTELVAKGSVDVENVEAYSARLPTIAKIYSPDDTLLGELLVAPDVDVEALLMLLCQIMGIHIARRAVLGLYVVSSKSNALAPMTLLPDKDFYIGDVYQAPLLQKYGRPVRFYVKRKLLSEQSLEKYCRFSIDDDPETDEQQQALVDLTFCQMTRRVAEDSIKISDHTMAATLAAYQLATEAEFIPGRVDIALGMGCLGYIGESLREAAAPDYWGAKVAEALYQCVDVDDDELKERYLNLLESIPSSCMQTYMCVKGANCSPGKVSHIPDAMIVGIDDVGLHFMDGEADVVAVVFSARYSDIRKFAVKTNSIRFTLDSIDGSGTPYDLELVTPLNEEISQYCLLYRPVKTQSTLGGAARTSSSNSASQVAAAQSRLDRLKALA